MFRKSTHNMKGRICSSFGDKIRTGNEMSLKNQTSSEIKSDEIQQREMQTDKCNRSDFTKKKIWGL